MVQQHRDFRKVSWASDVLVSISCSIIIRSTDPVLAGYSCQHHHHHQRAGYTYNFGIPALTVTPAGTLLSFCQASLASPRNAPPGVRNNNVSGTAAAVTSRLQAFGFGDGRGPWTDIALRRSTDGGSTWGALQVICRNSTKYPPSHQHVVNSRGSWCSATPLPPAHEGRRTRTARQGLFSVRQQATSFVLTRAIPSDVIRRYLGTRRKEGWRARVRKRILITRGH